MTQTEPGSAPVMSVGQAIGGAVGQAQSVLSRVLVEAEPDIFRPVPGGWGRQGSTNVQLAAADEKTLKSALTLAWTNVTPKPPVTSRKKKQS